MKTKKLTRLQQDVVDHMRAGWVLRRAMGQDGTQTQWLEREFGRDCPIDVPRATLRVLRKAMVIYVDTSNGFSAVYKLTDAYAGKAVQL